MVMSFNDGIHDWSVAMTLLMTEMTRLTWQNHLLREDTVKSMNLHSTQ